MQGFKGVAIASAVAAMLAGGVVTMAHAADTAKKVKCVGANECKGKSECHSADSSCAGQNACKGKGWLTLTEAECKKKGGKAE